MFFPTFYIKIDGRFLAMKVYKYFRTLEKLVTIPE